MTISRRDFLRAAAAASALAALRAPRTARADDVDGWTRSVCRYCGTGCGLFVGTQDGKVVAVKGDPENHNAGLLCLKGLLLPQILGAKDRCLRPLVRRRGTLVPASWDEAMALVASRLRETIHRFGPDSVAFYGSGQAFTEETWVANKLFKAGIRTNNVDSNVRLCLGGTIAGAVSTFGADGPIGCYDDLDSADVFLVLGSNAAETHPILFRRVLRRKETGRDVKVVVVDPRRTPTSRIADLHLSLRPGGDLAVLNAMAHVLVAEGLVDERFVADHVAFGEGAEPGRTLADYRRFLEPYTPAAAAAMASCRAEDIVTAARWFGERGRAATSLWCSGLDARARGAWAGELVHNLHLVTGKIGAPGSTPLSLAGQPNACGGVRDGGALSHTLPFGRLVANARHRAELERLWGLPAGALPAKPGLAALDLFRAVEAGRVKALYVMGANPGQSLPNLDRWRRAMAREDAFLVVSEAFHPTRTTELADVVLPAALWAEKEGVYGCAERRTQLLAKAVEPAGAARPDFEILCDLARRLGHARLVPYRTPADAWEEILACSRGTTHDLSGATRARLARSPGVRWPCPAPDHPGTRRRYVRGEDPLVKADHPRRLHFYGRPDGKAVVWLRPHRPAEEAPDAERPLWLTTGRVIEHWNGGLMTRSVSELRQAGAEAVAELHPQDASRLGVKDGDRVRLGSRRGTLALRARLTDASRQGLVFVHVHDPERPCGRLGTDAVDPGSGQPELKSCAVKVEKA